MTRALPGTKQHQEIMRAIHAEAPAERPAPIKSTPVSGPAGVLVLMACGGQKLATDCPVPLHQLYTGPMWQTLRTHRGAIPWRNVFVLSGGLGFVPSESLAKPYEAILTEHKAARWRVAGICGSNDRFGTLQRGERPGPSPASLVGGILPINGSFSKVIIGAAGHYRDCLEELLVREAKVWRYIDRDAPVLTVAGGIGQQRRQLGEHLASAQL